MEGLRKQEHDFDCETSLAIIGQGTMGSLALESYRMANTNEIAFGLGRNSGEYAERIEQARVILLATKQEDGLRFLQDHRRDLREKIVISLLAYTDLETLDLALGNENVRMGRVMTDTSFNHLVWTDDGQFSEDDSRMAEEILGNVSRHDVEYAGSFNDERMHQETMKACLPGWLALSYAIIANSWADVMSVSREEAESLVVEKSQLVLDDVAKGRSFSDVLAAVATKGGATEAGILAGQELLSSVFSKIILAGDAHMRKRQAELKERVKKGLVAETN